MARIQNTEPPKFHSLFVPQIDWFQELLAKKALEGSLSKRLIELAIRDLKTKKMLSKKEIAMYEKLKTPEIKNTRFSKDKTHSTFSLYFPKHKDQQWIRTKLDPEFLRDKVGAKSRSHYIWDLFVRENANELSKAQLREWDEEVTPSTSGKKKTA